MNVSDAHVSDKDGYRFRSYTIKANSKDRERENLDDDYRFASKIKLQPWEIDTDVQLHEERVISVRKKPKSRVLQEKCPRWNVDTLETSCRCDVAEFQELVKVAQKTVVTPQVPR